MILLILLFGFGSINEKLDKLRKTYKSEKKEFDLKDYLGKPVSISIDNEDISNSYLFSSVYSTVGTIKAYDEEWLLFQYKEHKNSKSYVEQYIRIKDITSIHEKNKKYLTFPLGNSL